ncbi:DUF5675 family protein, partial [Helicobacter didelphidarum]|uniref:DUF5675 family protein n=1 Tax=Helicobacter didelphidarum TaxID=2040648 RepID=UPI001C6A38C4
RDLTQWENHYFLERSGYDCITPNLELRIPEGRYELSWHKSERYLNPQGEKYTNQLRQYWKAINANNEPHKDSKGKIRYWKPLLNLHNKYLHQDRNILIHSGGKIQDSQGCLLVGEKIDRDKSLNPTRIATNKTFDIASKLMSFLMDNDKKQIIQYKGKSIEKYNHLLATNKKIPIPNITFIIRNNFGEIAKSEKIKARDKLSLRFNGKELMILEYGEIKRDKADSTKPHKDRIFVAFSGNALSLKEKEELQENKGYTHFVEYEEKGLLNDTTYYFCLDKEWQQEKDKGAMPEGEYYININDINDRRTIFSENTFGKHTSIYTDKECGNGVESHTQRDNFYLSIYTDKDCSNTTESHTQRENFYLHGGDKYGNNGGIDVGKNDKRFFNTLETLKKEYNINTNDRVIVRLEVEYGEEDLSNIEVVGQNGIDISLVSEHSKNILRKIAKNSNYTRVVISSTARTPRRQAEIMYNNIIQNGMKQQRNTYKAPGQQVLNTYENQKKAGKSKEEIIQAMTNIINKLGASNVSRHCADFNVVNVVDIPHSSLGQTKEIFKSEVEKLISSSKITQVLDENGYYHIVIPQP